MTSSSRSACSSSAPAAPTRVSYAVKGRGQKHGLLQQLFGAAIEFAILLELARGSCDRSRRRCVRGGGRDRRARASRRRARAGSRTAARALLRRARGRPRRGSLPARRRSSSAQLRRRTARRELCRTSRRACQITRQDDRRRGAASSKSVFQRAAQLLASGARRHEHERCRGPRPAQSRRRAAASVA